MSSCYDTALHSGDKTNKLFLFSAPTSVPLYLPPTIAQYLSLQHSYLSSINDQHKRGPEACVSTNRKLVHSIQFQPRLAFFNSAPNGIFLTLVFGGEGYVNTALPQEILGLRICPLPTIPVVRRKLAAIAGILVG